MSLNNLVGKTLEVIDPDATVIKRLLSSARRNIADAQVKQISSENRFDAGYKAIMQLSIVALQANGYRTLTSKPGHHMTVIQLLNKTVGLDQQTVIVLDALRKQRHVADYSGDTIPDSALNDCLLRAEELFQHVMNWLKENKSELLD